MTTELTPVFVDASTLRQKLHAHTVEAVQQAFPIVMKDRTLTAEDVRVLPQEYGSSKQRHALFTHASLTEPVKATLVLKDTSGKVIDTAKDFTLARLPYLTERHTLIADGNEYQVANQLRRKPGVYTQRGDNGELKTVYNLGKGKNFELGFDDKKGTFHLAYGTSNIPLYPVLRALGASHADISTKLGTRVAAANEAAHGHQVETAVARLYDKVEHEAVANAALPHADKVLALQKKYEQTTLDPEVTRTTLGHGHEKVTPSALLAGARRLLAVHRGEEEVDDTDSLRFKTFHALDNFIAERIKLTAREWAPKAKMALNNKSKTIRDALHPGPFSAGLHKFITTSSLAAVPTGINPLEIIDHAVKVTSLGEGGIPSDRAIPSDARQIHNTQFGALDPIRTPECFTGDALVLTKRGWVRWDAVLDSDRFACMTNAGTQYYAAYRITREPYKGELYGVRNMKVDHLVTPNHRVYASDKGAWGFQTAEESYGKDLYFKSEYGGLSIEMEDHYKESFEGLVYCATVPGGLLYVKRAAGLPHWSGNSNHSGVDIRASIVAHRDDHGNLYTYAKNLKTGESEFLRAGDQDKHVIAFPHEDVSGKKFVSGFVAGMERKVRSDNVTHQIEHVSHLYSPATTLIPLIHNIQGNRAIMGSKMGTQALPLLGREAPLLQVRSHLPGGETFEQIYGHMVVPTSPVAGTVKKIDADWIYVQPSKQKRAEHEKEAGDAALVKIPFQTHFPFPSKTELHHTIEVKPGDKVEEGQRLGDSNFTRNGTLALGKNLRFAYVPHYGYNSNDAIVISESCAQKLTSEHTYREIFPLGAGVEVGTGKHRQYYGTKYSNAQYAKLDTEGVVRKGARVDMHDILVAAVTPVAVVGTDAMLGRLSKALTRPFADSALTWEHQTPGVVLDVVKSSGQIAILVQTHERMQIGDKLAPRYGNKGVVAKITPDHEMLRDASGKPVDVLFSSASIVSRINPAQVIEIAVAKVAEKTGKPIAYDNGAGHNAVKWARQMLAEHGLSEKERLYDPVLKRHIVGTDGKGVLVGPQYTYKLFKSTDTNFAGHGVGPYDLNEQPLKTGGADSAKGTGKMEFDALLAHNARNFLQESSTVRGQKNDEFWKALQSGLPLPAPKPSFAFEKFTAMLQGAGVRVDKRGSKFKLLPMTDKDVAARSNGAIENNKTLTAKGMSAETGGLFDPRRTGGPTGTLYAHIDLHEPVPNPVFAEPVRRLLGLTQKKFDANLAEHGGAWFHEQLKGINVEKRLGDLREQMKKASGAVLNDVVKQIKYLEALKAEGLKPHDAYVLSKIPVIPPVFRPILPQPNDPSMLMVADANRLYAHVMDSNHVIKTTALASDKGAHRQQVYNSVAALFGTEDVANDELRGQGVKGFLSNIAGVGTPKGGFFQRKLMRRNLDVSGRGTAVPDPNLGMDEVGIPEDMLWRMWDKILVARLIRTGYPALDAREMVNKRTPVARNALVAETKERPVDINRAPTLHRYSYISAYPVLVQGQTIRVSPFIEKGMNLDYDGDTLQVHGPVGPRAVEEAKGRMLSNLLMSDQRKNTVMAFPQHEAVMGITHAVKAEAKGAVKHFDSDEAVMEAYRAGKIGLNDHIEVAKSKTAGWVEFEDEDYPVGEA